MILITRSSKTDILESFHGKSWDQQLWVLSTLGGKKQDKVGGGKDIMFKYEATINNFNALQTPIHRNMCFPLCIGYSSCYVGYFMHQLD